MIFTRSFTQTCTLKDQEIYSFDISKKDKEEGMKRKFENPLLIYKEGRILALYGEKGKLNLIYFISCDGFIEGVGEHGCADSGINWIRCKCGKLFQNSKKITAQDRLNKHLQHIKELKEEYKDEG